MSAPPSNIDFRTANIQALLGETRAVGVALAGVAFGSGIGVLASALLWTVGTDSVGWGSFGFTCLAGAMFAGLALVATFSIRLKASLDRRSSLEENIMACFASTDASNYAPLTFGKAVKRARVVGHPTALRENAAQETAALLERLMLPR
ncbi:hypothetical protein BSFA1_55240 [Burkholderia sp. SFA1]|nr:hypothetical protein BSFA1_55240 [Burkholderia sp. SFA1]